MYEPKRLKGQRRRRRRHSPLPYVAIGVLAGFLAGTLTMCSVPVHESPEAGNQPHFESSIPEIPEIPEITAVPVLPRTIEIPEIDFAVDSGDLYGRDDLARWEDHMLVFGEMIPDAERISGLIKECYDLLNYKCSSEETLVQALAKTVTAEIGGLTDEVAYSTARMEEAAVVWCVLNRVDAHYDAGRSYAEQIEAHLKKPAQFAYRRDGAIFEGIEELCADVLIRWQLEKSGLLEDCGRVLPKEHVFFGGDGEHNHFRTKYDDFSNLWDWSLPDPYIER